MQFRDTSDNYGIVSKLVHWLVAILMIAMLVVGFIMANLPKEAAYKMPLIIMHKSLGVVATFLSPAIILWWLFLRGTHPAYPQDMNSGLIFLAKLVKLALLSALIIMPWSGYLMATAAGRKLMFFDLFQVPTLIALSADGGKLAYMVHVWLALIASGIVIIHILAAIKHHYINRDNVLKRMLF